jgi:hypothetical protein
MEKTLDTDQDTERLFRAAPLVVGPLLYVTFLSLQDALDRGGRCKGAGEPNERQLMFSLSSEWLGET